MSPTRRSTIATALLLLLGLWATLALPRTSWAAGFIITVNPGGNDVPLALPPVLAPEGDPWGDAGKLWEIVHRDLEMTGYFQLIDPNAYIEQRGGVEPGTFDFADWRAVHATALAKIRLTPRQHDLQADVYVYDVNAGVQITARGFVSKPAELRHLAHRVADAIVVGLTGQPSFFGAVLAAVGTQSGNKEIYLLDIDGEGVRAVTRNGSINLSPAWSADGGSIAWTSYKRGNPDVYLKDLASGRTQVLSNRPGINSGATFSPDGKVAALARSDGGDTDVFLIDATTGADVMRLTHGGGIDVAPDYSPEGRRIAYASERSGGSHVYIQDVASGEATRVTFSGDWNMDPVLSPDGTKVAYVTRADRFDIMVVDVDGKNAARITQDMGDNEDPCWSPDGRYLVFSSTRQGRSDIWIATADGRHQAPITHSGGWYQPTWHP